MNNVDNSKRYDLENRSFEFAKRCRGLLRRLPRTISNAEDGRQLIRASGSVGANYIEANNALGKKDFLMRLKISRKEAKEANYWLKLLAVPEDSGLAPERDALVKEADELTAIFGAIITNSGSGQK